MTIKKETEKTQSIGKLIKQYFFQEKKVDPGIHLTIVRTELEEF